MVNQRRVASSPLVELIDLLPSTPVRSYLAWAYHAMRVTDDVIDEGFLCLPVHRQYRARSRMLAALNQWYQFVRTQHRAMQSPLTPLDISSFSVRKSFSYPGCVWYQSRRRQRLYKRSNGLTTHAMRVKRNFVVDPPPPDAFGLIKNLATTASTPSTAVSRVSVKSPQYVTALDQWWEAFCLAMKMDIQARPLLSLDQWHRYAHVSISPAMIVLLALLSLDTDGTKLQTSQVKVPLFLLRSVAITAYLGHINRDAFHDMTKGWRMVKLPWPLIVRAARLVRAYDHPHRHYQMFVDSYAQRRPDVYTMKRQRAHMFLSQRVRALWRSSIRCRSYQTFYGGEQSRAESESGTALDHHRYHRCMAGVFSWHWCAVGNDVAKDEQTLSSMSSSMSSLTSELVGSELDRAECQVDGDSLERFLQLLPEFARKPMSAMLRAYYP